MSRMTSKKRSPREAQGEVLCCSPKGFSWSVFHGAGIPLSAMPPFYRLNVTGFRKKNCGFNFRNAKKSFRSIASVSLYRPRIGQGARRLRFICPCDLACGSFSIRRATDFPTTKHWISNEQY
jgi:hypothetical protein